MSMPTPNQTPPQQQQPERIKNTDVEWFRRHVKSGKRLERIGKRLDEQRKRKEQGKQS